MPERQGHEGGVYLASASPVRADLLKGAGVNFTVEPADIDESSVKAQHGAGGQQPSLAAVLAEMKALKVSKKYSDSFVVGADQTLKCNGEWFDKPPDMAAARATLSRLRGQRHTLTAAVCVAREGRAVWRYEDEANLEMRPFSDRFLDDYLATAEESVLASVGAYRLEGLGAQLFSAINGDYFTVLGLPLLPILEYFRHEGVLAS